MSQAYGMHVEHPRGVIALARPLSLGSVLELKAQKEQRPLHSVAGASGERVTLASRASPTSASGAQALARRPHARARR